MLFFLSDFLFRKLPLSLFFIYTVPAASSAHILPRPRPQRIPAFIAQHPSAARLRLIPVFSVPDRGVPPEDRLPCYNLLQFPG